MLKKKFLKTANSITMVSLIMARYSVSAIALQNTSEEIKKNPHSLISKSVVDIKSDSNLYKNTSQDINKLLSQAYENAEKIELINIKAKASTKSSLNISTMKATENQARTTTGSNMEFFRVETDLLNYQDSLTDLNSDDFYLFNVDSTRILTSKLLSSNTDYFLELYSVDLNTGYLSLVSPLSEVNEASAIKIQSRDYALRVSSRDKVGDPYTILMNSGNPFIWEEKIQNILMDDSGNSYIVYTNNTVFLNGKFHLLSVDEPGFVDTLDWERTHDFSYGGSYTHRKHSISSVKIKNISGPIKYSSAYASSNEAVIINLDVGTRFSYVYSSRNSDGSGIYTTVDTTGGVTPRRFDAYDMEFQQYLIYDLNSKRVIDFDSVLNFYYNQGIESKPVITYIK